MQYRKDAEVLTSDGKKAGEVEQVVVDPKSMEVTHLVVRKGFIFRVDKVIPLDMVQSATEERVVLREGVEDTDNFPDFVEVDYVPHRTAGQAPLVNYATPVTWYYPYPSMAWWGFPGYANQPKYFAKTQVNIPEGTIALAEGAEIRSRDGKDIGHVERLYTEPKENRVTHIVIERGLITKKRKLVPTMWIDNIAEDLVQLCVDSDFIDRLPEYVPASSEP
jgi:uncharacterized protein YrrD